MEEKTKKKKSTRKEKEKAREREFIDREDCRVTCDRQKKDKHVATGAVSK